MVINKNRKRRKINITIQKISIIIINFNTKDLLRRCLNRLLTGKVPKEWMITVVDNNSPDESAEMVRKEFPVVTLIEMKKNIGFPKAVNTGIKKCKADYYLILNSDTEVTMKNIEDMITFMQTNSRIGAMTPRQVNSKNVPQLAWGKFPTFFSEISRKRLQNNLDGLKKIAIRKLEKLNKTFFPDWVAGSTMMLRHKALEESGLMDEKFFIFFEDIDLCTRVRHRGWQIAVCPEIKVIHHRGEAAKTDPFNSSIHYRRSQLLFWKKHHGRFSQYIMKIYLFLKFQIRICSLKFKKSAEYLDAASYKQNLETARKVLELLKKYPTGNYTK